ncbi:hypothetical protein IGI04_019094 [Brassica rapa subsp. trilocularis]|uniref:Uncharacterized protein n=1 Tax=Brassica rapa subsp. trilocularis TaxID=1813537 RepID=A0ABQ7MFT1_BRACM|nr:hypothetical protein IGI04_019094 [Brassica rapa subsp. trilocularis]
MARFVCRRGGEGAWWIGRALSGSSSGVTYWRSLFAVEWSVDACWSCGQGLFVVLRLRSLEVSASSVIYGRLHQQGVALKRKKTVLGSLVLGSSRRLGPSFESLVLNLLASLFLITVTEDPVSSLSSLQPDLLGGSELLYLLPVFGARFPPQSTVRYKCWGDYQNLATPAMSRGVEESGIRGNEVNPTSLWLTSMAKNGD